MKKLYYVRHGQSQWNVENKICGSTDVPLTEKGYGQAEETAKIIMEMGIKIDEIIYSPLMRAKDTALTISRLTGIPAKPDMRIFEQNFGKYEGISPRSDEEFQRAKRQFVCSYEGGESMLKVAQRVYNLLDEIKLSDKTYMLVAHNGIARVVKSYFDDMTNEEYAAFGVRNCSVTEFEFPE